MAEIGAGTGSGYPAALDTNTTPEVDSPSAGKTLVRAAVPNDLAAAIVALETELGTDPAGTLTDVKTYLQTDHKTDGAHKNGILTPTAVTGTDTYAATLSPAITSYVVGAHYFLTFANANSSAVPTLNLNALGVKTIKKLDGAALSLNDIVANHPAIVKYDGTDMILLNPAIPSKFLSTTATGTDTYVATLSPAITIYENRMHYFISFTNANTLTTPTLNLNALGAKTIKKKGSAALAVGDISALHAAILKYDGTDMILLNPASTVQTLSLFGTLLVNTSVIIAANTVATVSLGSLAAAHKFYLISAYTNTATTIVTYGSHVNANETVSAFVHVYIRRDSGSAVEELVIVNGSAVEVTVFYKVYQIGE